MMNIILPRVAISITIFYYFIYPRYIKSEPKVTITHYHYRLSKTKEAEG